MEEQVIDLDKIVDRLMEQIPIPRPKKPQPGKGGPDDGTGPAAGDEVRQP